MSGSDDNSGMNTLDLLGASRGARFIVRLMLRQKQVTYTEMREQLDLTQEELDEGIEEMLSRGWMYVQEVDGKKVYSAEIQKKEGSEVTRRGRDPAASAKITELWDKVDGGVTGTEEGREVQREMASFHEEKRGGLAGLDEMVADSSDDQTAAPVITPVEINDTSTGGMVKPLMPPAASKSSPAAQGQPPEETAIQPGGLLSLIRRWFKK